MYLQKYIVVSRLKSNDSGELDRPEKFFTREEALRYAQNLADEKTYDDTFRYSLVMAICIEPEELDFDADVGKEYLLYSILRNDFHLNVSFQEVETA